MRVLLEFKCLNCSLIQEHIESPNHPPDNSCNNCGGKLGRVMTAPAIHVKGNEGTARARRGKGVQR